ncbi:ATP/GTP-binding protein [Butyricimonas sp. Marseille-P3923]|uniref:AAA family ATPase n=1 Tax=Butyricimonas sp. Marseille-P3923 TaxID=1987504 RepID=UPI000C06AFBB|nr:ATP-binding protein [Butyricimonas sp. Marseille-P3923]
MILRVTIKNLYSFKEETEISFVAGKSTIHGEQVSRAEKRDGISVLKTGIIYGANASGKSNIIKAVSMIQKIALSSIPKKYIEPFKLTKPNNLPSKIELEFKAGKKFFAYGVEFTIKGITEEWLYEINSRTDREIYTRKVTAEGNEFTFGPVNGNAETQQLLKFISQSTPVTDSFLAEYIKRNGKGLPLVNDVYRWMKENLKIIFPNSRYNGISIRVEKDKDFAAATKSLLEYFNTGIADIRRIKVSKEDVDLPKDLINNLLSDAEPNKNYVIASSSDSTIYFFETDSEGITTTYKQTAIHKTSDNDEVPFEMSEESDGSIRLLDFIPMLIDLRLNESVYLVDEIDRSMHPMLSQKLLEYYFNHLSDERDTQLIFSTHESNLLNLDLIRADEVWFIEKGHEGASHLTSLAEYKPREDIRKGYLQGRYGAIPFFAPIKSLKW